MFGLTASEILLIGIIALVLFGNEKLPENLKKLAHSASKVKSFFFDVNHTWQEMKADIKKNIDFEEDKKRIKECTTPIDIVPKITETDKTNTV